MNSQLCSGMLDTSGESRRCQFVLPRLTGIAWQAFSGLAGRGRDIPNQTELHNEKPFIWTTEGRPKTMQTSEVHSTSAFALHSSSTHSANPSITETPKGVRPFWVEQLNS